ncbi:MAG: hypothetical protein ACRCVN_00530 [Spirochaetia bacterium]
MTTISPGKRKAIVFLFYTFLLLMFLAAPLRNLHPLVKEFHKVYGFAALCMLCILHLISVKKIFLNRLKKQQKTLIDKMKIGSAMGLGLMMILMILAAYTRKIWAIELADGRIIEPIRDFHTMYGPAIFAIMLILHVYAMTRNVSPHDAAKTLVRKDYKGFFPVFITSFIIVSGIAMRSIIVQNIARRLGE